MHITQWGEYGIHCSVCIARAQAAGETAVSAQHIADDQQIALDYAQQILQRLRRGGVIESIRGPSGGYRLCRAPETLTLRDVLVAAEGETFEVICESKPVDVERCAENSPCYLRELWLDLRDHIDSFLSQKTLADMLKQASASGDIPIQIGGQKEPS